MSGSATQLIDSDHNPTESELASQASQQLLLDLQQAVATTTHPLAMSREKGRKARATNTSSNPEPSSKRRKLGGKDQDISESRDRSLKKGSSEQIDKGYTSSDIYSDRTFMQTDLLEEDQATSASEIQNDEAAVSSDKAKPKLKRFGSEDSFSPQRISEQATEDATSEIAPDEEADDSENDAPEEAMVGAVQDRTGAAEAKAAKAHAKNEELKRARRHEHDRRMEDQATLSKKAPTRSPLEANGSQSNKAMGDSSINQKSKRRLEESTLPTLLPEELLAKEFTPQMPVTPKPQNVRESKKSKQKVLLDKQDKPPKDLFQGNTRIRVLAQQASSLPPKSNSKGKHIREGWLLGQRGYNEKTWTPRVSESRGFVRNQKRKR